MGWGRLTTEFRRVRNSEANIDGDSSSRQPPVIATGRFYSELSALYSDRMRAPLQLVAPTLGFYEGISRARSSPVREPYGLVRRTTERQELAILRKSQRISTAPRSGRLISVGDTVRLLSLWNPDIVSSAVIRFKRNTSGGARNRLLPSNFGRREIQLRTSRGAIRGRLFDLAGRLSAAPQSNAKSKMHGIPIF